MTDYTAAAEKFFTETEHLDRILERVECEANEANVALALSQAKRVRRECQKTVQALARLRDSLE